MGAMLLVHSPPANSMRVKAMLTKSAAARLPALLCSFLPLDDRRPPGAKRAAELGNQCGVSSRVP